MIEKAMRFELSTMVELPEVEKGEGYLYPSQKCRRNRQLGPEFLVQVIGTSDQQELSVEGPVESREIFKNDLAKIRYLG